MTLVTLKRICALHMERAVIPPRMLTSFDTFIREFVIYQTCTVRWPCLMSTHPHCIFNGPSGWVDVGFRDLIVNIFYTGGLVSYRGNVLRISSLFT